MKITLGTIVGLVGLLVSSFAHAEVKAGFSKGNDFHFTPLEGTVEVFCRGFSAQDDDSSDWDDDWAIWRCRDYLIKPGRSDSFVRTPPVKADKVILKAFHEDGSTRKKQKKFDAAKGKSKDRFNLWNWALFNRPLLERGTTQVDYTLKFEGETVDRGSFKTHVTVGEKRKCKRRRMYSWDDADCRVKSWACERYYRKENYCKYD